MTRSPFEMTQSEYSAWEKENQADARKNLFAIVQPFVYEINGQIIAQHGDGLVQIVRSKTR